MKTAVVMVTIGPDSGIRRYSLARASAYAERHGYVFVQITEPSQPDPGRTPHWEKVCVTRSAPGYDRYLIIDEDVLINTRLAPALPDLPPRKLGMVREPVPTRFEPPMRWLGNSGVLLLERSAFGLLERAYDLGELRTIEPGFGDQPAINQVAWEEESVTRLGWRWNYIVMADWLRTIYQQHHPWTRHRWLRVLAKVTLLTCLGWANACRGLGLPVYVPGTLRRIRSCHIVHLIWFRVGAGMVNQYLG